MYKYAFHDICEIHCVALNTINNTNHITLNTISCIRLSAIVLIRRAKYYITCIIIYFIYSIHSITLNNIVSHLTDANVFAGK